MSSGHITDQMIADKATDLAGEKISLSYIQFSVQLMIANRTGYVMRWKIRYCASIFEQLAHEELAAKWRERAIRARGKRHEKTKIETL